MSKTDNDLNPDPRLHMPLRKDPRSDLLIEQLNMYLRPMRVKREHLCALCRSVLPNRSLTMIFEPVEGMRHVICYEPESCLLRAAFL